MPQVVLLVGTRKGCFMLESDGDRRDWKVRGPFCEGWPIFNAVHDPTSGALYAAAASEWHGAGVWRSNDLGETWTLSSEGLTHSDPELKLSKIPGLTATPGRILAGTEAAGIFESRDGGAPGRSSARWTASPGRDDWNDPDKQPPGHLGLPAILPHPDEPSPLLGRRPGVRDLRDDGRRRLVDAAQPRAPGGLAARDPEVGYCVHKLVMSPVDRERMYQQNHCGMHRSDDGGQTWSEITDGLPSDFGFAAAAHPHDRESFYVIPLDPGHGRCMPEGHAAVWRTSDGGSSWRRLDHGLPAARRASRRAPRGDGGRLDGCRGPLLRHEHGTGLRQHGRR